MPVDILLTVIATSVVQSIFGVGVLLFGTPLLLLLGYGFVDALGVFAADFYRDKRSTSVKAL